MSTAAQIHANRENAKKSSGPSETVKQASSQNRVSHGLTRNSLLDDYQPTTETESILVNAMVESHWRANRTQNLADSCIHLRYQTMHTRAFYKSLNDLLKLTAETQKAEIGFEAQKLKQSAETRAVETFESSNFLAPQKKPFLAWTTRDNGL